MISEKIKQHAGKILFSLTGIFLILIGAIISRQRTLDKEADQTLLKMQAADASAAQAAAIESARILQENIANEKQQKMDSIASNLETVTKQETVPVTKVVPGETKKVSVPASSSSSKSTSSKSTSSTKSSTPAPAKTTKTS